MPANESVYAVATTNSRVYVGTQLLEGSDSMGFLYVIDVSHSTAPRVLGRAGIPMRTWDVSVQAGYAYLAGDRGFAVVDVSQSEHPTMVGWERIPDSSGVAVAGSHAFVAGQGLQVLDMEAPQAPIVVANLDVPSEIFTVEATDSYVYGIGYHDLHVIDTSNPSSPVLIASITPWAWNRDVCVGGPFVYVAGHSGRPWGLMVIDVASPSLPRVVGTLATELMPVGCTMAGSLVVLVTGVDPGPGALSLIDVSQPDSPWIVGDVGLTRPGRVSVDGSHAYVAGGGGLEIVDISITSAPRVVGRVSLEAAPVVPAIQGSYAYVGGSKLHVVDVSTATHPILRGTALAKDIAAVALNGPYVFALMNRGLLVLPVQCE